MRRSRLGRVTKSCLLALGDGFLHLADFLLNFARDLFHGAFGSVLGVARHSAYLFLELALCFVKLARKLIRDT
jgi:hypothetical protein